MMGRWKDEYTEADLQFEEIFVDEPDFTADYDGELNPGDPYPDKAPW